MLLIINIHLSKIIIMNWLEKCKELAKSATIGDRIEAIKIFATETKMQDKKGECDNCKFVLVDKRSCNNSNYSECNIFTNSLFEELNVIDWVATKNYLDEVRQNYTSIGTAGMFALQISINPLLVRYEKGERSKELHDEILSLS